MAQWVELKTALPHPTPHPAISTTVTSLPSCSRPREQKLRDGHWKTCVLTFLFIRRKVTGHPEHSQREHRPHPLPELVAPSALRKARPALPSSATPAPLPRGPFPGNPGCTPSAAAELPSLWALPGGIRMVSGKRRGQTRACKLGSKEPPGGGGARYRPAPETRAAPLSSGSHVWSPLMAKWSAVKRV